MNHSHLPLVRLSQLNRRANFHCLSVVVCTTASDYPPGRNLPFFMPSQLRDVGVVSSISTLGAGLSPHRETTSVRDGAIRHSQAFILHFRCQIVTFQHSQKGLTKELIFQVLLLIQQWNPAMNPMNPKLCEMTLKCHLSLSSKFRPPHEGFRQATS